jgi:DNA-binding transcriptional ArsR family regulator
VSLLAAGRPFAKLLSPINTIAHTTTAGQRMRCKALGSRPPPSCWFLAMSVDSNTMRDGCPIKRLKCWLMSDGPSPRLRAVHRALADPLRIRLYELLVWRPQSAKELAERVGMRPDRLYHHLGQLEEGKLIEVAEYRRLPAGKVERVYAPASIEPSDGVPSPADVALLFGAALETTRADVNAAAEAQEAGEDRTMGLGRTVVHLNQLHLDELKATLERLFASATDRPDEDGVWTTLLWVAVDRQGRRRPSAGAGPNARETKTDYSTDKE